MSDILIVNYLIFSLEVSSGEFNNHTYECIMKYHIYICVRGAINVLNVLSKKSIYCYMC